MTSLAAHPPQRLVLADLVPKPGTRARALAVDAALVLTAALFTAAMAQVAFGNLLALVRFPLPETPVPVTAQTLAVLLTAASLGPVRGMLGQLTYVLLGATGLPFYNQATGGVDVVFGATGGYLIGFIPAAFLIGAAAKYGMDRQPWKAIPLFVAGQLVIFAVGVPWLGMAAGFDLGTAIAKGFTPFVVVELVKAALAGLILPAAWWLSRRMRRTPQ